MKRVKQSINITKETTLECNITFLDDKVETFKVLAKTNGYQLYQLALKKLGDFDSCYFGLAFLDIDGNHRWLKHKQSLLKLAQGFNRTILEFSFSVRYYVPHPNLLVDDFTRYLFALQIKRDFFQGILHSNRNTSLLLAGFIVQSELGDYKETDCKSFSYLRKHHILRSAPESYLLRVMELHQNMIGLSKADADRCLLDAARKMELYGVHLQPVTDISGQVYNLGVTHVGILVFRNFARVSGFSWSKVRKLSFRRRSFVIKLHPSDQDNSEKIVEYYFTTLKSCKNFWSKCIEQHCFFRTCAPLIMSTAEHRSLDNLTASRAGSAPHNEWLRRSVSCEDSETIGSVLSSAQQYMSLPTPTVSQTSQTSTPLRRLARIRHRRYSLKATTQNQNVSVNNVSELQTSGSETSNTRLEVTDFPYPSRKISLPARLAGVSRLLSNNSNLNSEHFQLLRLSLTSLLSESQSSLHQPSLTLPRKRTQGLSQQHRAISTPTISHTSQTKVTGGPHSFVPRCLDPMNFSTITRSKAPSYSEMLQSSESTTFPKRPKDKQPNDGTFELNLPPNGSSKQVTVRGNDEPADIQRSSSSSYSLPSNSSPNPVSLSNFSNVAVTQFSSPEGEDVAKLCISDEASSYANHYPTPLSVTSQSTLKTQDEFRAISSPKLIFPKERSESAYSNETDRPDSSSTFDEPPNRLAPSAVPETLQIHLNQVECIPLTSTEDEQHGDEQFKILLADSDTLIVTHSCETQICLTSPESEDIVPYGVASPETQSCAAVASEDVTSPLPSDPGESRDPEQPVVVDKESVAEATSLVSTYDDILNVLPSTNQPGITAGENSDGEISIPATPVISQDSASDGEIPESLADVTSFGAISMLTGISCFDEQGDSITSNNEDLPNKLEMQSDLCHLPPAKKLHTSLRQLGRGYWGASDTSSERLEFSTFPSFSKPITRIKSESCVHKLLTNRRRSASHTGQRENIDHNPNPADCPSASSVSDGVQPKQRFRIRRSTSSPHSDEADSLKQLKTFLQSERLYQRQLGYLQSHLSEVAEANNCDILCGWMKLRLIPVLQPLVERHMKFVNTLESYLRSWEADTNNFDHEFAAVSDEILVDGNSQHSSAHSYSEARKNDSFDASPSYPIHKTRNRFSETDVARHFSSRRRRSMPACVGHTFIEHIGILDLIETWITRCPELMLELWLMAYSDFLRHPPYTSHLQPLLQHTSLTMKNVSSENEPSLGLSVSSISDGYESVEDNHRGSALLRDIWQKMECSDCRIKPLLVSFLQPGRRLRQYCLQIGGLLAQHNNQHSDLTDCKIVFSQLIQYARALYADYMKAEQLAFTLQAARLVIPIGFFLGFHSETPENGTPPILHATNLLECIPRLRRMGWLKKYSRRGFRARMVFLFHDRLLYASRIRDFNLVCLKVHGEIYLRNAYVTSGDPMSLNPSRQQTAGISQCADTSISSFNDDTTYLDDNMFAITIRTAAPLKSLTSFTGVPSEQLNDQFRQRHQRILFAAPNTFIRNAWLDDLDCVIEECLRDTKATRAAQSFSFNGIHRPQGRLEGDMLRMQLSQRLHRCRSGDARTTDKRSSRHIMSTVCKTNLLRICWRRHLSFNHIQLANAADCEFHGYLYRKLQHGSGWQKFWTVLSDYCLHFYRSPQDEIPQATVALYGYTVRILVLPISTEHSEPICTHPCQSVSDESILEISLVPKKHLFRAESHQDLMSWFHSLSAVLSCIPTKSPTIPLIHNNAYITDQPSPMECDETAQLVFTCSSTCFETKHSLPQTTT